MDMKKISEKLLNNMETIHAIGLSFSFFSGEMNSMVMFFCKIRF